MARPKLSDRVEKLEKSMQNARVAIWALVAGLIVVGASIMLQQTEFIAKFL